MSGLLVLLGVIDIVFILHEGRLVVIEHDGNEKYHRASTVFCTCAELQDPRDESGGRRVLPHLPIALIQEHRCKRSCGMTAESTKALAPFKRHNAERHVIPILTLCDGVLHDLFVVGGPVMNGVV